MAEYTASEKINISYNDIDIEEKLSCNDIQFRVDILQPEKSDRAIVRFVMPHSLQIEALHALNVSRMSGAKRALIHAAPGFGKTCLAAFASASFRRILFVAHREEILKQAEQTFRAVRLNSDTGIFAGDQKNITASMIFASVHTLGKLEYLCESYFAPDAFDYIVIDEIHHGVTRLYQNILHYFKPMFILGLTGTPERMDGRSVYELCHYQVPYELSIRDAIRRKVLVPFHYYGIFDKTDYSRLHLVKGRYDEKELNETYIGNVWRFELIVSNYRKMNSRCAIGFCCSRLHANMMADEFNRCGISAVSVCSNNDGTYAESRDNAIKRLRFGDLRVIFSVDILNEGVDIPEIDLVMFLRPTESPTVFLQQLGRGLRTAPGKEFLNVLDFIGNYHRAEIAPKILTCTADIETARTKQEIEAAMSSNISTKLDELVYPEQCTVELQPELINLFERMAHREKSISQKIYEEFERVSDELGHVPSRMELFEYMQDDVYTYCLNHPNQNPFRNYFDYLNEHGLLSAQEQKMSSLSNAALLIRTFESTSMTRSYKMPVLQSFCRGNDINMNVTIEEILDCWKAFYAEDMNWQDLPNVKSLEAFRAISDKEHIKRIMENPVHFLIKSSNGIFVKREGYAIALNLDFSECIQMPEMRTQIMDIIAYRTNCYYRRKYIENALT